MTRILKNRRRALALPLIAGWLIASAAFAQSQATNEVAIRCAPFGSIIYVMGNAMQDISQKANLPFKLINGEGPGSTAVTLNMAHQPEWKNIIGCTSVLDYVYAKRGVKPFFKQPDPDVATNIKVLFNGFYGAVGILTLNPNLKSLADLNGKKLGMGRLSQGHWGGLPMLFLETGAPDIKPKVEFLGPEASHEALADGRVDATITQFTVLPDGSKAYLPGVVAKLLAGSSPVYAIGFDPAMFDRAKAAGVDFKPILIGKSTVDKLANAKPVDFIFAPAALTVNKDFPEDKAYAITKMMIEHAKELGSYSAELTVVATPKNLLGNWTAADLHPGAARAYREAGLLQ